jgi:hypothetical protein
MLHYIYYKLLFRYAVCEFSSGLTLIWRLCIQALCRFSLMSFLGSLRLYKGKNMCIMFDNQAASKALDNL